MSLISLRTPAATAKAGACPLCEGHAAKPAVQLPAQPHADLLPWAIVLTAAFVVACVGLGPERLLAVGATGGLLAGAACAWASLRTSRRSQHAMHDAQLKTLAEDADSRVEMVIKQFEWAVNDVAKLKRDVDRSQAAADALVERARERERYVKRLERQLFETRERLTELTPASDPVVVEELAPDTVPFRWGLHLDGGRAILELYTGVTAYRPSRLRIVDRDGQVIAVSAPPAASADGGSEFAIAVPGDLVADLDASRELNYAIEALVEYEWKPARLEDSGRRTRAVTDKQGRLYRVNDADAAQLRAPAAERASALN